MSAVNAELLLVEDDVSLRETTKLVLEDAGMRVDLEGDGKAAVERIEKGSYDLVVLDLMLPTMDGLDVCREVRKTSKIPIIMLTARATTTDVVVGLELGADDYVTKPFDPPALIARVRAVLRRSAPEPDALSINAGPLSLDPSAFRVTKSGKEVELSATDFKLLYELVRHSGQVMTREVLLRRVWDYEYLGDSRMVDMAILRLRAKVEDDPKSPVLIQTVRGVGYRFQA